MIAALGAVIGLIGGGMDAYGNYQSGIEQNKAEKYNAAIARMDAAATRQSGAFNEYITRRQVAQTIGLQRASYAKAGVSFTGSVIDTMMDSLTNAELSIAADKYNTEVQARRYESEATMREFYGKQAKRAGTWNAVRSLLSMGSSAGLKAGAF